MRDLTRITTQFDELEDRVKLSGETPEGTVVLWLPQRLLNRLIPALCEKLQPPQDIDGRAEALNAFAQMAAVETLTPSPVVQPDPQAEVITVRAVTLMANHSAIQLVLKEAENGQGGQVSMALRSEELRQWLAILHGQYVKAGWPTAIWPGWIARPAQQTQSSALLIN